MGNTYTHLNAANGADDDYFLDAASMKNGAYTLTHATPTTPGARRLTVTHTSENDYYEYPVEALGTLTIVGKSLAGQTITEVITPVADDVVTGRKWFTSLVSVTGAGWVESGGVPDTLDIGYSADICVVDGVGRLERVVINATHASTVVLADAKGTIATLKASIAEGSYQYDLDVAGFLTVDLNGTQDVTVIHSQSLPTEYAMS
jgi:hypothetical protein